MASCFDYKNNKWNTKQIQRIEIKSKQSKANDTPGIVSEQKYPAMQSVHCNTLSNESTSVCSQPDERIQMWMMVLTSSAKPN